MIKIAINGFGRIGKNFLRAIMQDEIAKKSIQVKVVNLGNADLETAAYAFKYDTNLKEFKGSVEYKNDKLIIDNLEISLISELDAEKLPWSEFEIDWVVDCSGKFTTRSKAEKHLKAGAPSVLLSAPAESEDLTVIPGINLELFDKAAHKIISLGSCTTNAFAPMIKVLHDNFKVSQIFMTTIHAYTNSQALLDVDPKVKDVRRSRAAALNIVPTTTGAMKVANKLFPELEGKIFASALRIPVPVVSLIDLTALLVEEVATEEINKQYLNSSRSNLKNILDFTNEHLVSSDYMSNSYSVTIDGPLTNASKNLVRVFGWYDNEWAYSERMKDFLIYISKK